MWLMVVSNILRLPPRSSNAMATKTVIRVSKFPEAPATKTCAQFLWHVVLSQDFTDHFAVHIGQSPVDAVMAHS
jgi:hypothetical protein